MNTDARKPLHLSKRELFLLGLFLLILSITLLNHFYLPILQEYRSSKNFYQQTLTASQSGLDQAQKEQLSLEIEQLQQALANSACSPGAFFSIAAFLQFMDDTAKASGVVIQLIELSDPKALDPAQTSREVNFRLETKGSYTETMQFLKCWYAYKCLILSDSWGIYESEAETEKDHLLHFESDGKILIDRGGLSDADAKNVFSGLSNRDPFAQR